MVLFTIFCPIVAAVLIMLGAPARKTALAASVLTFAAALFLFASLDHRYDRRIGSAVGIKLGSDGEYLCRTRRDPEASPIVPRNRKERLTPCYLHHPLLAGVTNRNG